MSHQLLQNSFISKLHPYPHNSNNNTIPIPYWQVFQSGGVPGLSFPVPDFSFSKHTSENGYNHKSTMHGISFKPRNEIETGSILGSTYALSSGNVNKELRSRSADCGSPQGNVLSLSSAEDTTPAASIKVEHLTAGKSVGELVADETKSESSYSSRGNRPVKLFTPWINEDEYKKVTNQERIDHHDEMLKTRKRKFSSKSTSSNSTSETNSVIGADDDDDCNDDDENVCDKKKKIKTEPRSRFVYNEDAGLQTTETSRSPEINNSFPVSESSLPQQKQPITLSSDLTFLSHRSGGQINPPGPPGPHSQAPWSIIPPHGFVPSPWTSQLKEFLIRGSERGRPGDDTRAHQQAPLNKPLSNPYPEGYQIYPNERINRDVLYPIGMSYQGLNLTLHGGDPLVSNANIMRGHESSVLNDPSNLSIGCDAKSAMESLGPGSDIKLEHIKTNKKENKNKRERVSDSVRALNGHQDRNFNGIVSDFRSRNSPMFMHSRTGLYDDKNAPQIMSRFGADPVLTSCSSIALVPTREHVSAIPSPSYSPKIFQGKQFPLKTFPEFPENFRKFPEFTNFRPENLLQFAALQQLYSKLNSLRSPTEATAMDYFNSFNNYPQELLMKQNTETLQRNIGRFLESDYEFSAFDFTESEKKPQITDREKIDINKTDLSRFYLNSCKSPSASSSSSSSSSSSHAIQPAVSHFEPPPRFQCESCQKSYSTQNGLSKHREFHCTSYIKKRFTCPHCEGKTYTSLGALKMHIRTHTLPCRCKLCGKAFSRPWLLQGHLRTHTGEKPFDCPHCSRAFADRSNLRAHLQTHSEVKKYNCKHCDKSFSRMSLLLKHKENTCGSSTNAEILDLFRT